LITFAVGAPLASQLTTLSPMQPLPPGGHGVQPSVGEHA
jgi:hypothetical protein